MQRIARIPVGATDMCRMRTGAVVAALAAPLIVVAAAGAEDMGLGTPADQKNLIAGICATQLGDLGTAGCSCLAERSLTELDDPQRAYLILSVVQPPAAERLPIARSQEQLAAIFGFLEKAHTACATPGAPPAAEGGDAAPQ